LLNSLRRFFGLDAERKRLFLQAYAELGLVRHALRTTSFKQLTQGLTLHRAPFGPATPGPADEALAERVGWAVRAASRYTPWSSTCLVQVLAAQRMLQKRSIPGAFYIGAAPGNGAPDKVGLAAHAWLKCGEQFITGEAGHQHYTVVSTFSWP
jgi:hypothetical protein